MVSYLGGLSEELLLSSLLGFLLFLEKGIIDLRNINSLDINLGASGQSISLVDSLEGDTVGLVWAGDQEEARGQLLEEHNTSASESASEENKNATWGDTLSELSGLGLGVLLVVLLFVFSGVPSKLLHHFRTYNRTS